MLSRYLIAWIPMVVIAIGNGLLREAVFAKRLPELRAHQLSCLTGIALFGGYVWILSRQWPLESISQAATVGAAWLAMTITFEFLFGHFVVHFSWPRLLHDYNLRAGRLWPIVLAWVAISPYVFYVVG